MYDFSQMNPILVFAAVIPAVILLVRIYKLDKLEKEPMGLLLTLVVGGIIATLIAIVLETVGEGILAMTGLPENDVVYRFLLYFVVVGGAEEGAKYLLLKNRSWKNKAFNCKFDAIVYATYVALGFALWENIGYVSMYGLSNALVRAATAVPGHTCFGVFMGLFYGRAKAAAVDGNPGASRLYRRLAFFVPVLFHGAYDFLATSDGAGLEFIGFTIVMFIIAYARVKESAKRDAFFQNYEDLDVEYYLNNNNPQGPQGPLS